MSIRKQFFTGFDIKTSQHWLNILCLTLKKTVFGSLPFHIQTQIGEQIAILYIVLYHIFIHTLVRRKAVRQW